MAEPITYYVAMPFCPSEDGPVPGEAKECQTAYAAERTARALASQPGHCGAIAFSRSGDPGSGDFDDAKVLLTVGLVASVAEMLTS